MLLDRVAIGHAGNVIGDRAGRVKGGAPLVILWQQLRLTEKRGEQIRHNPACLGDMRITR